MPDLLKTRIGKLELKNPVMVASGTFGYGEEFSEMFNLAALGAVVTKGISLKPREGNPMPRIVETPSGMINAIGLANVGVEKFLSEKLPFLVSKMATVIVNVFGSSIEEYEEVSSSFEGVNGIAGIEVNISCPNVKAGGVQFGTDPEMAKKVIDRVRKSYGGFLMVKLSPQVSDIRQMARAMEDVGADALSLINTVPAMAIDSVRMKPVLTNVSGGLSGPAVKPIALKLVYDASRAVKIPIVGLGGIMNSSDAAEFLLAGASAIQVGTANFVKPSTAWDIVSGIKNYCLTHGFTSIDQIRGKMRSLTS
ncbi:MAG TPA: dihydroorotate dehydrogenase [bacterium]|nr:dihydroorotate dehydrogenase [bacterium]